MASRGHAGTGDGGDAGGVDGRRSPLTLLVIALAAVAAAALGYWAIVISEGAYFGPRLVTWFYDRDAAKYDEIKGYLDDDDQRHLVEPLIDRAGTGARILDVATGTARLPASVLSDGRFSGEIVGLDLSKGMLRQAWMKVGGWSPRVQLVRFGVDVLPFDDGTFDAVTCLEALEFLPQPLKVLAEIARVVRPGGSIVVTNRVGWESRFLPGRAFSRRAFEDRLRALGLEAVETRRWQSYYDLIWCRRPESDREVVAESLAVSEPPVAPDWTRGLRCPGCGSGVTPAGATLRCAHGHRYLWRGGAWDLTAWVGNDD